MPAEPTVDELLEFLAAIRDALSIGPPSAHSDEDSYRRALCHRALLVRVSVENFHDDPGAYSARWATGWVREQAAKAHADQQDP